MCRICKPFFQTLWGLAALRAPVFLGSLTRKKGASNHSTHSSQLCCLSRRDLCYIEKIREKSQFRGESAKVLQLQHCNCRWLCECKCVLGLDKTNPPSLISTSPIPPSRFPGQIGITARSNKQRSYMTDKTYTEPTGPTGPFLAMLQTLIALWSRGRERMKVYMMGSAYGFPIDEGCGQPCLRPLLIIA
jgi:hypothetical protein